MVVRRASALPLFTLLAFLVATSDAYNVFFDPLRRVRNDYLALSRRVSARHILLPAGSEDAALTLKRRIRDKCVDENRYVEEVFANAARKFSVDDTTSDAGGLIGELVPQGYCSQRCPELDRACFRVTLGELEGPIESNVGVHLLLVTERTNCPKLDGKRGTKLEQTSSDDIFGTVVQGKQVGKLDMERFASDQLLFWLVVFLAGGILAEVTASFFS